jgi:hypothetical protein
MIMEKKFILFVLLFNALLVSAAENYSVSGSVIGEDGKPLMYASVLLLNPADSTLQFFGITNNQGAFEVKNIREGNYLVQISFLGNQTIYRKINIPLKEGNDMGTIVMKPLPVNVGEVKVTGERIPLMIKKDTVEYNAAAFKLKPDAVTEDLLKKLPGIEVDRAGNVKAMGEDVKRVYVEGKEFFGNDPKIATKNIPAKAVDKVQVYDRKSEESMFTGINDGSREKTINLDLREDQKNALFGDLIAGGGTNEHFLGSAKAYRFTDRIQLAGLGMINNVNQFGFSMNDYINFSGGMGAMMSTGGSAAIRITSDGNFPVNFGQPVSGLNTAGAGGFNFSHSSSPNDRIFTSYLFNGATKDLEQNTHTENWLQNRSFQQTEELAQRQYDGTHRLNFGWRNRIDSTRNLNLNGNIAVSNGNYRMNMLSENWSGNGMTNRLGSLSRNTSDKFTGDVSGSYVKKIRPGKTVVEISGNGSASTGLSNTNFENTTSFFTENRQVYTNQFQDNTNKTFRLSSKIALTQKIAKNLFMDPSVVFGFQNEIQDRTQGTPEYQFDNHFQERQVIDSLSPGFEKRYAFIRPGITLDRNREKTRISAGISAETSLIQNFLNSTELSSARLFYLLPSFSYENEYRAGKRIMLNLSSMVNTPSAYQLLPVVDNLNSLSLIKGNPDLKPEYTRQLNLHWLYFDQFSFTSLFAGLNGSFTKDKINWDRTVKENLQQISSWYNASGDFTTGGNATFSTPIRRLGIKISLNLEENLTRGLTRINSTENRYKSLSHRISLSADNRKKEKLDLNTGIELSFTRSAFSIQKDLGSDYFDISWFGEIRYNPDKNWNFEATADITRYTAKSFDEAIDIPLLGAEISRFFAKHNRATLTLRCFDILNQNRIVRRLGEFNYLREIRTNSMGRYFMLTFTWRLNKFGQSPGGMDVKMIRR